MHDANGESLDCRAPLLRTCRVVIVATFAFVIALLALCRLLRWRGPASEAFETVAEQGIGLAGINVIDVIDRIAIHTYGCTHDEERAHCVGRQWDYLLDLGP